MKIPYGYSLNESQEVIINKEQANIVKQIYDLYLQGKSLGGIVQHLDLQNIPSPSGNTKWSRTAVDKILSNKKYIPVIGSFEQFVEVQYEKDKRSNIQDNKSRKTARYNSQNVLSGLLVCSECGRNYRRITRPTGEVVWRCADKVENGKNSVCGNSATISDAKIKAFMMEVLEISSFDEGIVKEHIEAIIIDQQGNFDINFTQNDSIGLHL